MMRLHVRCRAAKRLSTWFLFAGLALFAVEQPVFAQSPGGIQFQRDLLGLSDAARVRAMKSIKPNASDHRAALPIVAQTLITLAKDAPTEPVDVGAESDLPEGIQLMFNFVGNSKHHSATSTLLELLKAPGFSWRISALNQVCRPGRDSAVVPVISLIDSQDFRDSYGFRFSLARGLTRFRHPRAWFALANLYQIVDGQLEHRLHSAFQRVTVSDFRGDRQSLQRFINLISLENKEAKPPKRADRSSREAGPLSHGSKNAQAGQKIRFDSSATSSSYQGERVRLRPSKYYGIEIYAQRLLFVIDCSASMKSPSGETTRLANAKRELSEAIRGLDARCDFGIITFRHHVNTWHDQLVPASDDNKREAIEYVNQLNSGSNTNTYGALRKSLDFDDQLEALYMLTDGEPTTGAIINRPEILNDVLRRNQTRNITINTVALAVDPKMQRFLKQLTLPSEGEFRIVE